jgi:hypothetical protein
MKNMKLVVATLLLGGAVGMTATAVRAGDVISKQVLTDGSYCHSKFESIREDTLASAQPVLKDADDIIDFYGPCNEDSLGKEEIRAQKLEAQHRWEQDFND